MSNTVRTPTLPSLPKASLDLINTAKPVVDRFATPGAAVKKKFIEYRYFLSFVVLFGVLVYGANFLSFSRLLSKPRTTLPPTISVEYSSYLRDVTAIRATEVIQIASKVPFASLEGLIRPNLLVSQTLREQFTLEEQKYLILKSAGRSLRQHALREFLVSLALVSIAGSICVRLKLTTRTARVRYGATLLLACFFSVLMTQLVRMHEFEAEYYALEHMRQDPHALEAIKKLQTALPAPETSTVLSTLFSRQIPYDTKLRLARIYTAPKKTITIPAQQQPDYPLTR